MRDLNYQLKELGRNNRDGSHATQAKRAYLLSQIANQLHVLGFKGLSARSLRPKHVSALVSLWQRDRMAVGTIKNRLAAVRWWARKVNRRSAVAQGNDFYGIPSRQMVSSFSKAQTLSAAQLARITDRHVYLSLELQRAFGLRREEALKFRPNYADRGDRLVLKASWTKGGKSRVIPIRTDAQRKLLGRIWQLAGKGSLIPTERSYIQHLRVYVRQIMNAGLSKMHGLRHAYAQERYFELTGRLCPIVGGPDSRSLSPNDRRIDQAARLRVSRELGHIREEVLSIYIGR
ncbi:MAG: integrase domain-containing protein [Proteobacteria bacterium]|nr:integrase domain-containing protein [Pseudomonadota bacterium]